MTYMDKVIARLVAKAEDVVGHMIERYEPKAKHIADEVLTRQNTTNERIEQILIEIRLLRRDLKCATSSSLPAASASAQPPSNASPNGR